MVLLNKHLCLLLPYAAETFRRSTILLEESTLDKHVIKKLHSKNAHNVPSIHPSITHLNHPCNQPSVCRSFHSSIYPSSCSFFKPPIHAVIQPSIYLAIHQSYLRSHLSIYQSIHLCCYLFVYPSIPLSIFRPSIYLAIHSSIHGSHPVIQPDPVY